MPVLTPVVVSELSVNPHAAMDSAFVADEPLERNSSARNSVASGAAASRLRENMLAAIAHEVNQPLYAIKNYSLAALATLHQLDSELSSGNVWFDKLRTALDTIAGQVERGSRIVAELKSLAGQNRSHGQIVDMHDVVVCTMNSIRLRSDLDDHPVTVHLAAEQSVIRGEGLQLELVLSNLVLNAIDATRELHRERRSIEIRTCSVGKEFQLQVLDQGCGVEERALPQLFEPYVTHKSHGLGMGLAICRDIVSAHRGEIGCQRRQPYGMEFFVHLPLA